MLDDLIEKSVEIYIDDAIMFAQTKKEVMTRLDEVLSVSHDFMMLVINQRSLLL